MKIMQTAGAAALSFLGTVNNAFKPQDVKAPQQDFNRQILSYPQNYYTADFSLSFGRGRALTNRQILENIGRENFPSPVIAERLETEKDKTLYEIHKDHYKELLNCKSLGEAKEKYPEFQDVKDAADLDLSKYKHIRTFNNIQTGKIKGVKIENLTLELLKKRFALMINLENQKEYFNLARTTVKNVSKTLNIPDINRHYMYYLYSSNPEFKAKAGEHFRKMRENDDGTLSAMSSAIAKQYLCSPETRAKSAAGRKTAEFREGCSLRMHERLKNNPEFLAEVIARGTKNLTSEETRQKARETLGSDEFKAAQSKRLSAFYQTERGQKLKEARSLAGERAKAEFQEEFEKLRKEFPQIRHILERIRTGKASGYDRMIQNTYWKRVSEEIPDYRRREAEIYKSILAEWGLIEQ